MIKKAPLFFFIAVLLVSCVVGFGIYRYFMVNLEMKNDLIASYEKKATLPIPKTEIPVKEWKSQAKIPVIGKTFRNESVILDGFSYSKCTFINVKFVYKGEAPFDLAFNEITGSIWIDASNPPIYSLVLLLKELNMLKPGLRIEGLQDN